MKRTEQVKSSNWICASSKNLEYVWWSNSLKLIASLINRLWYTGRTPWWALSIYTKIQYWMYDWILYIYWINVYLSAETFMTLYMQGMLVEPKWLHNMNLRDTINKLCKPHWLRSCSWNLQALRKFRY